MRSIIVLCSVAFISGFGLAGCGGKGNLSNDRSNSSSQNQISGGPFDGSWKLSSVTCGSSVAFPSGKMNVRNGRGSRTIKLPSNCSATVPLTFAYPSGGQVSITWGSASFSPSGCSATSSNSSTSSNSTFSNYFYVVSSHSLILNSGNDPSCPGKGYSVSYTKLD